MVELMVKFFYTFDYAMPDKSEASHLDLHTRVYTIADRYEVLDLKAMAMQRFRKGLRCKNGQAMIQAARVLEEIMPLPICDTTLHDLVIRGLDWGGEALFADIGETGVSSLFKEISWLSAALATRVVSILRTESLCGHLTNGSTQSYRLDRREKSIQYIRHCLQKAFLSRHQAPKEEEMYAMSKWLSKLLKFEELESSIIRATKIHKVLKAITKLVSIPKDEIFGLKRRSAELFKIYHERVESADEAVEPSPGQRWLMSLPPATTAKAKNAKRKA